MKHMRKILAGKLDLDRRMVAFYALAAVVITLIFSLMISLYGSPRLGLALLATALNNAGVMILLRLNKKNAACFYLIANGWFTMTFALFLVDGISGGYWFSLIPLAGGLLLRRRGIIFGLCLALPALAILVFRSQLNQAPPVLVPDATYMTISMHVFVVMIGFMAWLFLDSNAIVVARQTRKLDNLLNIVTHDIANPLTLISGHTELLISQGQISPAHGKALNRIARASEVINEILHQVRQIQAAKAGKLRVETSAVSLVETFEKLRFIFEDRLRNKNQRMVIDASVSYQDDFVMAEPVMLLNEVFSNLISNAIKFSPPNCTIDITVRRDQDMIRIEVRDHGIGIPGNLLPYVFDDFRSTSRQGTEGELGTGFGLPLARHMVEAFGGTLDVKSSSVEESSKDPGTTFILTLRSAIELSQLKAS